MRCAVVGVGLAFLLLVGCSNPTPQPSPPPPASPPPAAAAPPAPVAVDLDKLDALLEKGDRAYREGRLLTPIDDCAYDYYRAALVVAPDHPAALHGLERVAERYVAMAELAASKEQYGKARQLLERARIVDPNLDSIATMQAQVDLRSSAAHQRTKIDAAELGARSPVLSAALKQLGARAKTEDAWVTIRAPTDADGRWIYQQMASGRGDRRIRAELTLGSSPAVDLLQLDASTTAEDRP